MDPVTLGILGTGAAQLIGGLIKKAKAKRPEYEIPAEAFQQLALAKLKAQDPYAPGYTQAAEQLGATTSNAIDIAAQSGNLSESLSSIVAQQALGSRNLQAQNIQQQANDQQLLMKSLEQMAKYQDQEFNLNELAPYSDMYNESREMIGAGLENLVQGGTLATIDDGSNIFKNLFKKKQNTLPSGTSTPGQMSSDDFIKLMQLTLLGGK